MDGGDYLNTNAMRSSFITNHVRHVHFTLPLLDPFLLLMQMKTYKILQYMFPPCPCTARFVYLFLIHAAKYQKRLN